MESPGEHLKRERELRGYTLKKVFEVTRVPLKYLEAIEADDFDNLPQPAFVKGFLRAYCKFLGIDDNDSVLRYDLYLKEKTGKTYELTPLPETTVNKAQIFPVHYVKWLVIVFIGIGIITGIIYSIPAKNKPSQVPVKQGTEPVVEQPKADIAPEAQSQAPPPPPPSKANTALTFQADKPVSVPQTSAQGRVKEPQPSAPLHVNATQQPAAIQKQRGDIVAEKQDKGVPITKSNHSLSVKANENAWIKIRIDDAAEPLDVLLRAGESVTWKASSAFSIIIGNAGGVSVSLDGNYLGVLGKSGEVVSLKLPSTGAALTTTKTKTVDENTPLPAQTAPAQAPKE